MGTLTITTNAPQDARVVAAFGARIGKVGNATAAEVKAEVIRMIKEVVDTYEADQNARAFTPAAFTPT